MKTIGTVDLGGTFLRTGWWRQDAWLMTHAERTCTNDGQDALTSQIIRAVEAGPDISGLVVATAGGLSTVTGHIHHAANLPLDNLDLRETLGQRLGVPVAVLGDAAAGTVAEFGAGAAKGLSHGAFLTISTGIGMGLVINGRLVSGLNHQAGELGHIPVDTSAEAPQCPCGQSGCLEAFASGNGLVARFCADGGATGSPVPDGRAVVELAERGHRGATVVVNQGGQLLGAALAMLIRLLSPQVLVLGGGLAKSRYYIGLATTWLERILAQSLPGSSRLICTGTCEPSNPLVGAALAGAGDLAARRLLKGTGYEEQLEALW
ncbi:MAG: ROK family protein [Micrococcales bacterium]|nr:ROK family protein [Micrococcales bacterium]